MELAGGGGFSAGVGTAEERAPYTYRAVYLVLRDCGGGGAAVSPRLFSLAFATSTTTVLYVCRSPTLPYLARTLTPFTTTLYHLTYTIHPHLTIASPIPITQPTYLTPPNNPIGGEYPRTTSVAFYRHLISHFPPIETLNLKDGPETTGRALGQRTTWISRTYGRNDCVYCGRRGEIGGDLDGGAGTKRGGWFAVPLYVEYSR